MKFIKYSLLLALLFVLGCKKTNYPGGTVSSYISLFDVRDIYKSGDVVLSADNMFGADKITGVVVSDHSGKNMPTGFLVLEDNRRLSQLRGIAIPIGADAANYVPGDSLVVKVAGKTLKRQDGVLQITGVTTADITKVASGIVIVPPAVKDNDLRNAPNNYESTLISVLKVGFDASYPAGTTYAGSKKANDGFGNIILHTEPAAVFAGKTLPFSSNYTGIVFNFSSDTLPQLWPRLNTDITILSATAPKIAPIIVTGYLVDPNGSDANYEYVQCMATKNIDFAVNNYSLVATNNAGASTPTGFPTNGWATGDLRTYKINMTVGTVSKGEYFYVGANKNIWGLGSTDISASKWISKQYSTVDGDGFGTKTANLLANSGNAAGIALFDLTGVTADTIPVDVVFFGGAGMLFAAPDKGYKICNNDYYDLVHPTTLASQPYFTMGSNTAKLAFPPATKFSKLGGTYNITTGRWTSARTLTAVDLTATSTVAVIEGGTLLEQ